MFQRKSLLEEALTFGGSGRVSSLVGLWDFWGCSPMTFFPYRRATKQMKSNFELEIRDAYFCALHPGLAILCTLSLINLLDALGTLRAKICHLAPSTEKEAVSKERKIMWQSSRRCRSLLLSRAFWADARGPHGLTSAPGTATPAMTSNAGSRASDLVYCSTVRLER